MSETPKDKHRYVMILKDRGNRPGKRKNNPFTFELRADKPEQLRGYFDKMLGDFARVRAEEEQEGERA